MPEPLDALTLPLRGSRLVEASAGTGKTWTIAALYVRLVLGHGEGLGRALLPGEILVMTFTKAATRELSDRIRRRLVEAAAFFRHNSEGNGEGNSEVSSEGNADTFLRALRESYAPGAARETAAWRLSSAAEAMDDASVHTIDAWCQRMLREHAFDSGCLFDEELQPNETQMLRQAAHDYWRQQVYPLQGDALAAVLAQWRNVAALIDDVRKLAEKPLPEVDAEADLASLLAGWTSAQTARLAGLKAGWDRRADTMLAWLKQQWARRDCPLNKQSLGPASGARWLSALREWALDPHQAAPDVKKGAENLRASSLPLAAKGGPLGPVPAEFAEFGQLMDTLAATPRLVPLLRAHALARVRQRLQHLKQQAGRYGYADMLQRLDDALDEPARGAHAAQLRQRILAQYPAALIDEFQDTSPRQLSIFDRVYRIAGNDAARALLLIGDPKQSIYAFRGADIHSYLQARSATAGRHHALAVNRRSTKALVQAVNAVFAQAEARPGRGAFFFRDATQPAEEGLPFAPVEAAGRRRTRGARSTRPARSAATRARQRPAARTARAVSASTPNCAASANTARASPRSPPSASSRCSAAHPPRSRAATAGSRKRLRPGDVAVRTPAPETSSTC
ncbi:MAG: UvrD-helicase domain-containing protein [Rubrivivax sp.]